MFGDAFGEMFGGGRRRRNGPARGQDLRYDLEITLEQAYAGAEVEITVPSTASCETCDGSGAKPGTQPTTCTDLRRPRPGARHPGLLLHRAHLPPLRRRAAR